MEVEVDFEYELAKDEPKIKSADQNKPKLIPIPNKATQNNIKQETPKKDFRSSLANLKSGKQVSSIAKIDSKASNSNKRPMAVVAADGSLVMESQSVQDSRPENVSSIVKTVGKSYNKRKMAVVSPNGSLVVGNDSAEPEEVAMKKEEKGTEVKEECVPCGENKGDFECEMSAEGDDDDEYGEDFEYEMPGVADSAKSDETTANTDEVDDEQCEEDFEYEMPSVKDPQKAEGKNDKTIANAVGHASGDNIPAVESAADSKDQDSDEYEEEEFEYELPVEKVSAEVSKEDSVKCDSKDDSSLKTKTEIIKCKDTSKEDCEVEEAFEYEMPSESVKKSEEDDYEDDEEEFEGCEFDYEISTECQTTDNDEMTEDSDFDYGVVNDDAKQVKDASKIIEKSDKGKINSIADTVVAKPKRETVFNRLGIKKSDNSKHVLNRLGTKKPDSPTKPDVAITKPETPKVAEDIEIPKNITKVLNTSTTESNPKMEPVISDSSDSGLVIEACESIKVDNFESIPTHVEDEIVRVTSPHSTTTVDKQPGKVYNY